MTSQASPLTKADQTTNASAAPEVRFFLETLKLTGFRNYDSCSLAVSSGPVVLTGPNGAGKTNLLEAISFLTPGRGLRRAKLSEIDSLGFPASNNPSSFDESPVSQTPSAWTVSAVVQIDGETLRIGTGRDPMAEGNKRLVRIDGAATKSHTDLSHYMSVLWVTPQMDGLFLGPTSDRRRFFDRLAYGLNHGHASDINAYEKTMRERARLLKQGRYDPTWLSALEAKMAEKSLSICATRRMLVDQLSLACQQGIGPFPRASFALDGTIETWLETMSALEAEEQFKAQLAENRRLDAESGITTIGPHRSDVCVFYTEKSTPAALGSTGEQKALLMSIILGVARLQSTDFSAPPLLLLDEVTAHFDPARRAALFAEIRALGLQAWMTGTDKELFAELGPTTQHFRVENGSII